MHKVFYCHKMNNDNNNDDANSNKPLQQNQKAANSTDELRLDVSSVTENSARTQTRSRLHLQSMAWGVDASDMRLSCVVCAFGHLWSQKKKVREIICHLDQNRHFLIHVITFKALE